MTVKQFLKAFKLGCHQTIRITDESRKYTYYSNEGLYCFEEAFNDHAYAFSDSYDEFISYIQRMNVISIEADSKTISIRAEAKKS